MENTKVKMTEMDTNKDINIDMDKLEFGEFLNNIRNYLSFDEKQMGDVLGLTESVYCDFEKGEFSSVNLESIESNVRELAKLKRKVKNIEEFYCKCNHVGNRIKELHGLGYNVVKISSIVEVDEVYVEMYLVENGYQPIYFQWCDEFSSRESIIDVLEDEIKKKSKLSDDVLSRDEFSLDELEYGISREIELLESEFFDHIYVRGSIF